VLFHFLCIIVSQYDDQLGYIYYIVISCRIAASTHWTSIHTRANGFQASIAPYHSNQTTAYQQMRHGTFVSVLGVTFPSPNILLIRILFNLKELSYLAGKCHTCQGIVLLGWNCPTRQGIVLLGWNCPTWYGIVIFLKKLSTFEEIVQLLRKFSQHYYE